MHTAAICKNDERRDAVRRKTGLSGLDYLDVSDDQLTLTVFFLGKAPPQIDATNVRIDGGRRVRGIKVVKVEIQRNPEPELDDCMVVQVDKYGDFSTYTLRVVEVENGRPGNAPRHDFDPRYAQLDFTFNVDCPSDLDCAPADTCPPPTLVEPEINYLAKDYASFRQLILDRLALIMPDWKERHIPDVGVALVELLAYVGDYLSYYQDAVAAEAYLDTARQRISVRRHARLADYHMHEGCNARAWVCVETDADLVGEHALDPKQVFFVTGHNDALSLTGAVLTADELQQVPVQEYEVFEPMMTQPIQFYNAHNQISFYTWGNRECCLPRGATAATLTDAYIESPSPTEPPKSTEPPTAPRASAEIAAPSQQPPAPERQLNLQVGDVLIFEEIIGPRTGNRDDADPSHRHAVRLIKVMQGEDKFYDPPIPIVEIEWAVEDALPFPLCISAISDASNDCKYIEDLTIAHGNVILVDHGRTQPPEDLGVVPCASTQVECDCVGHLTDITFVPGRFRPQLDKTPLTFSQPLPQDDLPKNQIVAAMRLIRQDVGQALPQIIELKSAPAASAPDCEHMRPLYCLADLNDPASLISTLRDKSNSIAQELCARFSKEALELLDQPHDDDTIPGALRQALINELARLLQAWSVRFDLLGSQRDDQHFVVEVDNGGRANLRFGDGELGQSPEAGASFFATYRVGNGMLGNVGAEAISHLVTRKAPSSGGITRVRNPLPARGGTEPESIAEVKLFAPFAFRNELQRAITANDYSQLVQRDFTGRVQRAAATLSWTGSWYEAQVAVDPFGSEEAAPQLLDAIKGRLYRYRRIGQDLAVLAARYVSLDIEMIVCILPHYLRGHVEAALLDVFSNRVLPNGRLGFFHPNNLTFGEGIYLSQLVAAAQAVEGVESVTVTKLQRLYEGANHELENGILSFSPLEVARLDNDPSLPEHGRLVFDVRGGR